jgi:KaiC/GvpD/RAD55 family RecA-like ATPase
VAKVVVQFTCSECGATTGRWLGRCPGCGTFGTLVEELHGRESATSSRGSARRPERLGDVRVEEAARFSTGVPELDRVLGGGLVPASLVLLGGEPGVGKSTLLLTALGSIARSGRPALLVTGEESVAQVRLRAERLGGADDVAILAETELDTVCATLEHDAPAVCVIDSVQTLYASELGSAPGSVAQVREAAARLLRVAKESGVATILVGHVTKDGSVAGPRVLEHLVDCVLQFEGDRYHAHRILRSVKNRFGSTNELGVFEMTAAGLEGVPEPSALFGSTAAGEVGAAVAVALEGTRPLLLQCRADGRQLRLGDHVDIGGTAESGGAEGDLGGRLLAGHEERAATGARDGAERREEKRGLAHSGLASHEDERRRHEPTSEHAVELRDSCRDPIGLRRRHAAQRDRSHGPRLVGALGDAPVQLFHERAERRATRAPAEPATGGRAALRAGELDGDLGHRASLGITLDAAGHASVTKVRHLRLHVSRLCLRVPDDTAHAICGKGRGYGEVQRNWTRNAAHARRERATAHHDVLQLAGDRLRVPRRRGVRRR